MRIIARMTILIIDDEVKARSLLRSILSENCEAVTEILEAGNLIDGVNLIREQRPKLVFLDIEMPQERGTEIFKYFNKNEIDFEIVFATAYDRYALKAFEMNAVDYILKPLRPRRVIELVEKIYKTTEADSINEKLEELRNSLKNNTFKKIGLPMQDGILFVHLDEIIHLEADGMYTRFYTKSDGEQIVSKPLRHFEYILESGKGFYRPHRSHIFNIHFIKQYIKKDGNYVVLENDHIIPITRDKRDEFLQLISSI